MDENCYRIVVLHAYTQLLDQSEDKRKQEIAIELRQRCFDIDGERDCYRITIGSGIFIFY